MDEIQLTDHAYRRWQERFGGDGYGLHVEELLAESERAPKCIQRLIKGVEEEDAHARVTSRLPTVLFICALSRKPGYKKKMVCVTVYNLEELKGQEANDPRGRKINRKRLARGQTPLVGRDLRYAPRKVIYGKRRERDKARKTLLYLPDE